MKNVNRGSTGLERCPYLGLHDDSSTALAYPSAWNYCYRATLPGSVLVSHQAETCLCPGYLNCPVYRSSTWKRLPSNLRGRSQAHLPDNRPSTTRRWIILVLLLALIVLLVVFLSQRSYFSAGNDGGVSISASSQLPAASHPLYPDEVSAASARTQAIPFPAEALTGASHAMVSTRAGTLQPAATSNKIAAESIDHSDIPSLTTSSHLMPTSTPKSTCGHALDTPFGKTIKFVIHRVARGENLTLYARQYETSTEAILAVNYHLTMPVWEDWIIVIPLETVDVSDVPPFEPYQAIGTSMSSDELATQLNTDPQSLSAYNAFESGCKTFSGWLLVPRKPLDS